MAKMIREKPKTFFSDSTINLTDKEEEFCRNLVFITDGDEVAAFDLSGYNAKTDLLKKCYIRKMLRRKCIIDKLDELVSEKANMSGVDKIWVTEKLKRIARDEKDRPQYQLKALELLARTYGMFSETVVSEDKGSTDPASIINSAFQKRKEEAIKAANVLEFKKKEEGKEGTNG
jgi:hypothetical protein